MSAALIGHTGFIGGNLARQFAFGACFNSKNIDDIRGREFDLLVCCGVTAVKWWANQNPAADRARIDSLLTALNSVRARRVILVSTVDVYPLQQALDETFECHSIPNHAYGTNRLYFEDAMTTRFADVTVVRIAGVFGSGLKKNVIYDLLHDNCLENINPASSFQYYNIGTLWHDLQKLEAPRVRLINFVTEPVRTQDIIDRFFPGKQSGQKPAPEAHYEVRTRYSDLFGGPPHYLSDARSVLSDLGNYIDDFRRGVVLR